MKLMSYISITLLLVMLLNGCQIVKRDVLFEEGLEYKFDKSIDAKEDYKIKLDDRIQLEVYTNEGYDLVRSSNIYSNYNNSSGYSGYSGGGQNWQTMIGQQQQGGYQNYNQNNRNQYNQYGQQGYGMQIGYLIETDGFVKLPVLNKIKLEGLTLREAEKLLEEKYSEYINKPYIKLMVTNRRVTILGAVNSLFYLQNEHTSLLEALSTIGGLPPLEAKSYNIKLIRGDLNNPIVKLINLSSISGMKEADLILKENDVIYIEPVRRLSETLANELNIFIGLINSVLLLVGIVVTKNL